MSMPQTRAEVTSYQETSLHADVMAFVAALRDRNDPRFYLTSFGASPGGRELPLVVMSSAGVKTAAEARAQRLPVVLIINGIHAGEVEGKEASQMLMRDILAGTHAHLLDKVVLVIVPLFNPDGNDAVDPVNRKLDLPKLEGQIGPKLVGTRVNGIGVNLNRDYMRQQALEMQLLQSRVVQAWLPDLTIDNHATNGSVHRFAMTYDIPHTVDSGRPEPIAFMRQRVMPAVTRALEVNHGLLAGWYGNFVEDERALDARREADPKSPVTEGWMTYPHNPRFGSNYRGLSSRLDLLLECYSYLTFAERVRTTYATMLETLTYVAAHADDVKQVVAASAAPRDKIAVRYKLEAFAEPIEIATCTPRTLDGAPTTVKVKYFANFIGTTVIARPPAYIVPPEMAAHLARHGIPSEPVSGERDVEVATVTGFATEGGRKILEASEVGDLEVAWKRQTRAVPAGARLVRTDHAAAAVAVYLCEPESDDGAVENGVLSAPHAGEEFPDLAHLVDACEHRAVARAPGQSADLTPAGLPQRPGREHKSTEQTRRRLRRSRASTPRFRASYTSNDRLRTTSGVVRHAGRSARRQRRAGCELIDRSSWSSELIGRLSCFALTTTQGGDRRRCARLARGPFRRRIGSFDRSGGRTGEAGAQRTVRRLRALDQASVVIRPALRSHPTGRTRDSTAFALSSPLLLGDSLHRSALHGHRSGVMAIVAPRSRSWIAGGAAAVVWCVAWTAVVATHRAAPVALAAAFDFVVTANLALWWFGRREVPRWMFGATVAIGLVFARLVLAGARDGGMAIAVVGGGIELAVVAMVVVRFRRARAAFRMARAHGEGGFAALIAALEAARMPRVVATVIATEVYVFAMAFAGWRRPAPKLTVHRANGFTLYAGVFAFLIVAETPAVHIALSIVSPIAAWLATGASVYSLFWIAGYAHAVRHGGVVVTDAEVELRIGVRWRARIARDVVAAIDVVTEAPADVLDASILGANTVVRFTRPVRIYGLFGRVREVDAIALSLDDRAALQLTLAEPLTRA